MVQYDPKVYDVQSSVLMLYINLERVSAAWWGLQARVGVEGGSQWPESAVYGVGQSDRLVPAPANVANQEVLWAEDCDVLCLAWVLHASPGSSCHPRHSLHAVRRLHLCLAPERGEPGHLLRGESGQPHHVSSMRPVLHLLEAQRLLHPLSAHLLLWQQLHNLLCHFYVLLGHDVLGSVEAEAGNPAVGVGPRAGGLQRPLGPGVQE